MFIRFGVSNCRSIFDYQEIIMTASKISGGQTSLIESAQVRDRLLPSAVMYGANASGKSNFIQALSFFVQFILGSHADGKASGGIQREVFALNPKMTKEASQFDADFVTLGIRYHYGFKIDNQEVIEEWLYAYPKQKRQVWFHRNKEEDEPFYFGHTLKGKNKTIAQLTRKNSLFLSAAAQNNHPLLSVIHDYFAKNYQFVLTQAITPIHEVEAYLGENEKRKHKIMTFLKNADVGISELEFQHPDIDENAYKILSGMMDGMNKGIANISTENTYDYPQEAVEKQKEQLRNHLKKSNIELQFGHRTSGEAVVFLPFHSESRGTKQLLSLLLPVFEALEMGSILVVDEIETSMHPHLASKVVALFNQQTSNPRGAQLIYSTHDTNMLSNAELRRDQIWFVEKGQDGASTLYPLTDIHTRASDNLERGYLQGRFGAIPFLGGLNHAIVWSD